MPRDAAPVVTHRLQSSSPCSRCRGSSASIVLVRLLSFAASVNGLRPRCKCSVAVAANTSSGPRSTSRMGLPMGLRAIYPRFAFCTFAPRSKKKAKGERGMSCTGLRLTTATSALAALRPLHEHTRRAHACRARSTRTHHACAPRQPCTRTTRQHALKSLAAVLESLATGCPSAGSPLAHLARMRSTNTLATSAARPHASPTCCACHPPPPLHVASVRRVLMTLIESKTIDTMKMTENTMDDASECVPTLTCGSYAPNPIRPHDAKHLSHSYQNKTPSNTPMAMEGPPF